MSFPATCNSIRSRITFIALVLVTASSSSCTAADADEPHVAAISSVDIGINGCFKVGCWTPVRVKVEVGGELKRPRVDVIVSDNDGVPTTATALIDETGNQIGSVEA